MIIMPFKSRENALELGFKFRGRVLCTLCGAYVDIYQRLAEMPLFVDPETLWPHLFVTHNDEPPPQEKPIPIDRKTAAAGKDV